MTVISGELQEKEGLDGTPLLTLPHFPQLSEGLIILWDGGQFQKWLLAAHENIQGFRPPYVVLPLLYLTQYALN